MYFDDLPLTLPMLSYGYDALEPIIDAETMQIHHQKHHQAYLDHLIKALELHPELLKIKVTELLANLATLPEDIKTLVQNHGGGHYNHTLFWQMLSPNKNQKPGPCILAAIHDQWGHYDVFVSAFTQAAQTRFGSGWAWLAADDAKRLIILSTPNQDSPIMQGYYPLLGIDVWEHAYYLQYKNRRPDYIKGFLSLINWEYVEHRAETIGMDSAR